MVAAGIGGTLFLLGLLLTFQTPVLIGRLLPLTAMAAGSLVLVAGVASPERAGTVTVMALTVVPMLLAARWLEVRLDRDRDAPTSLDEQPR